MAPRNARGKSRARLFSVGSYPMNGRVAQLPQAGARVIEYLSGGVMERRGDRAQPWGEGEAALPAAAFSSAAALTQQPLHHPPLRTL